MVSKDPSKRGLAIDYLGRHSTTTTTSSSSSSNDESTSSMSNTVFPAWFGGFLHGYIGDVGAMTGGGDPRIERIFNDFAMIAGGLGVNSENHHRTQSGSLINPTPFPATIPDNLCIPGFNEKGLINISQGTRKKFNFEIFLFNFSILFLCLVSCFCSRNIHLSPFSFITLIKIFNLFLGDACLIFTNLVLSNIRNCSWPSSQLQALDLLTALGSMLSDFDKVERIVSYLIVLLSKGNKRETVATGLVKAAAIKLLSYLVWSFHFILFFLF